MSRVAKLPIIIPCDVKINIHNKHISVIGNNGKLTHTIHDAVQVENINNTLKFFPNKGFIDGWAQAGTTRALINSMIIGVTRGFVKKLQLVGIGYRASIKDNLLILALGFSHLIEHKIPIGISIECPSPNEIILKGADKQLIGQVAADIYAYRRPEPYKGKGIRYTDKIIRTKEAKKK
ncbi:MAG: 50S ribosomal protein L6 [Candidatus Dasytiphilus stammeri]